jgi:ribosomal protein S18 acetylase RimI-like enzyme
MSIRDKDPIVKVPVQSQSINIRPATETEFDTDAFAKYALLAAHTMFRHHVGKFGHEMMRRLFRYENNHFSHDKTAFITVNNQVAGAISGYTHSQKQAQEDRTTWLIIRILKWRMVRAIIVDLYYTLSGIQMGTTRPADYYVQIVAVDEDYRGMGLSYQLLHYAETLATQSDCTSLTLDVAADNPIAIHAYETFGFEIVRKSPRRKPVIYQMRKNL